MNALYKVVLVLVSSAYWVSAGAKLPPPPPVDPAKAEEAKQKKAEQDKKDAEATAKYQDKAVVSSMAKAKAEGRTPAKPLIGAGVPPPPAPPAAPATPVVAKGVPEKPAPVDGKK